MAEDKEANPIDTLSKETQAAKLLLATLGDLIAEDDVLATDMVEAETNLLDAINAAIELVQQDEANAFAISERVKALKSREDRLKTRAKNARSAIAIAMDVAKKGKLQTPLGTVSIRKTPESLDVVDEAEIPATFWKQGDPKLDRKALLEALKGKVDVPGCKLSPAGQTIAIRT